MSVWHLKTNPSLVIVAHDSTSLGADLRSRYIHMHANKIKASPTHESLMSLQRVREQPPPPTLKNNWLTNRQDASSPNHPLESPPALRLKAWACDKALELKIASHDFSMTQTSLRGNPPRSSPPPPPPPSPRRNEKITTKSNSRNIPTLRPFLLPYFPAPSRKTSLMIDLHDFSGFGQKRRFRALGVTLLDLPRPHPTNLPASATGSRGEPSPGVAESSEGARLLPTRYVLLLLLLHYYLFVSFFCL